MATINDPTTNVAQKIDSISQSGRSTLYNTDGSIFTGRYESVKTDQNVINYTSGLSAGQVITYISPLSSEGFGVISYIIKVSASSVSPTLARVFGSYDGVNFTTSYLAEVFIISPQGTAMKEGIIEIKSQFPYLKLELTLDTVTVPSAVVVDTLRGNYFNGGLVGQSINFYGALTPTDPEKRGSYAVNFNGAGVATATYNYLAIYNPVGSKVSLRIDQLKIETFFSASAVTTLRPFKMSIFNSVPSSGALITPNKLKSTYPASKATTYITNPTLTSLTTLSAFNTNNSNGAPPSIRDISFNNAENIILDEGFGLVFGTTVALSGSDSLDFTIGFSEVA